MGETRSLTDAPTRPLTVRLIIWSVLVLGLANIWRAAALAGQWEVLQVLDLGLNSSVRITVALVWALLFLAAALAIRQRRAWISWFAPALLLLYALYRLMLQLCCIVTDVARAGLMAWVVFYVAAILFTIWSLNRPAARTYFTHHWTDQYDQSENRTASRPAH